MADGDFAYVLGGRFKMLWGNNPQTVFVVRDRVRTERGNLYWVQRRERPRFTLVVWEEDLKRMRRGKGNTEEKTQELFRRCVAGNPISALVMQDERFLPRPLPASRWSQRQS